MIKLTSILQEIEIKNYKVYKLTNLAKDWIKSDYNEIRNDLGEDMADAIIMADWVSKDNKTIREIDVISFIKNDDDNVWKGDYKSYIDFLFRYGVIEE